MCGNIQPPMSMIAAKLWYFAARPTTKFLSGALILAWLPCHASELAEWRDKMQSIIPHGYSCHYTSNAIAVDGNLNDSAWALAPWTRDFADISGAGKAAPRFRTRAKLLWDENYL